MFAVTEPVILFSPAVKHKQYQTERRNDLSKPAGELISSSMNKVKPVIVLFLFPFILNRQWAIIHLKLHKTQLSSRSDYMYSPVGVELRERRKERIA